MSYNGRRIAHSIVLEIERSPEVSLATLSRSLRLDRHTVERYLLQYTGAGFREHRKAKLLQSAIHLLSTSPSLCVKEIAFKLGFSSSRSLTRFLKTNTGMCSKEFQAKATCRAEQELPKPSRP